MQLGFIFIPGVKISSHSSEQTCIKRIVPSNEFWPTFCKKIGVNQLSSRVPALKGLLAGTEVTLEISFHKFSRKKGSNSALNICPTYGAVFQGRGTENTRTEMTTWKENHPDFIVHTDLARSLLFEPCILRFQVTLRRARCRVGCFVVVGSCQLSQFSRNRGELLLLLLVTACN